MPALRDRGDTVSHAQDDPRWSPQGSRQEANLNGAPDGAAAPGAHDAPRAGAGDRASLGTGDRRGGGGEDGAEVGPPDRLKGSGAPSIIYALIDPRDGRPFYVGQSFDPRKRLFQHIREARKSEKSNRRTSVIRELLAANLRPLVRDLETVENHQITEAEGRWERELLDAARGAEGGAAGEGEGAAGGDAAALIAQLRADLSAARAALADARREALRIVDAEVVEVLDAEDDGEPVEDPEVRLSTGIDGDEILLPAWPDVKYGDKVELVVRAKAEAVRERPEADGSGARSALAEVAGVLAMFLSNVEPFQQVIDQRHDGPNDPIDVMGAWQCATCCAQGETADAIDHDDGCEYVRGLVALALAAKGGA